VRHPLLAGASLVLVCSTLPTLATPEARAGPKTPGASLSPATPPAARARRHRPAARPTPRPPLPASSLYSRRTIRLVRSYLRLKLLEIREADLERARKVVERKLGIKALLVETPSPPAR
jgi:hypothetical protein